MAFADDLLLLTDSNVGLRCLIFRTIAFLRECGMALNHGMYHTVALFGDSKPKGTVVNVSAKFTIERQPVRALTREYSWSYLGIEFTPRTTHQQPNILAPTP